MAHGYAITGHRSQGATVDVTALEDGGGRELAYVKVSRASQASHVYVVAATVDDAAERLAWVWGNERRQTWAIDRGQADEPLASLVGLYAERRQLTALIPPGPGRLLGASRAELARVEAEWRDLQAGRGRWAYTAAGQAARHLVQVQAAHQYAAEKADNAELGYLVRRHARRDERQAARTLDQAHQRWLHVGQPHAQRLAERHQHISQHVGRLEHQARVRDTWLDQHPEVSRRLGQLDQQISQEHDRQRRVERQRWIDRTPSIPPSMPGHERGYGLGHGRDDDRDIGLGL